MPTINVQNKRSKIKGYTIHSTIDKGIYDAIQASVANYGYLLDDGKGTPVETGNVLMDNKNWASLWICRWS